MKNFMLLIFCCLFSFITNAQTNETPGLFTWKGKKTVNEKGYVVLKSGKKLEGQIVLKGNENALTEIQFTGDGKEIDFPLAALAAYGVETANAVGSAAGINTGAAICDHNESLFTWRVVGEVMGKMTENTKPGNGYVVKRDGSKIEGELQLKKEDGNIVEFKIKGSSGKTKLAFNQVANYGLLLTIAELTKSGEKVFKDEARNFHRGTVNLTDGSQKEGMIAFKKKKPINPNKPGLGNKYLGLYFATDKNSILKTYLNSEITSVSHNGLSYSPYEGGFVAANEMDNASFRNKLKEFNGGTITLADGTLLKGKIALINQSAANYKSQEGILKRYAVKEIKRFDVQVAGESKAVINVDDKLTEEYFAGNTFLAYKNPTPTTVNEKRTSMARSLAGISTSAISAIVISEDEKKNGYETNLDSIVMNSSAEQLVEYRDALLKINGYSSSEELQDNSNNETAKKYDAALNLAIGGKSIQDDILIYYDEIILKNRKTNESVTLYKHKKDLNGKLEGLLMGCYTFLSFEKKEQKAYYDLDNIRNTAKMLDQCY